MGYTDAGPSQGPHSPRPWDSLILAGQTQVALAQVGLDPAAPGSALLWHHLCPHLAWLLPGSSQGCAPSFREACPTCAPTVPLEKRELGQGGTAYGTFSGAQTSLSFALFCYQEILVLYLGSSGFAFIFTLLIPLNFSLDLCPFPSLCHTVVRSQLGTWHVKPKVLAILCELFDMLVTC